MSLDDKNLNPFRSAETEAERERIWKSLREKSERLTKEEADRLIEEAIRLQKNEQ